MTLHELLSKLDNIESYGLYFVCKGEPNCAYSPEDDIPNCTIQDIIKHLDYEVQKCHLGIFDNADNTKFIRACISLYY